jgi:hypothetical protein
MHISDMPRARTPLNSNIDTRIAAAPGHHVWTPSDFLDLGGRDAVDKALQRRVGQGDFGASTEDSMIAPA